jgi:hypothetical protein
MKKFVFVIAAFIASITMVKAQIYTIQVTPELSFQQVFVCLNQYNTVEIYAMDGCDTFIWTTTVGNFTDNPLVLNWDNHDFYGVAFYGCDYQISFEIDFIEPNVPNETSTTLWKHQGYPVTLEAIGADSLSMYDFHWNTDETTGSIDVTAPGTYTCEISDYCDAVTRTFIVHDNVELYRATCDLRSNLNQVTWQTTPHQAEYISAVNIYRNTYQLVATVPYLDGSFTDDIGSESTQWQYHVVAVDNDGNECPIPSYWKRTIHLDHVQGTQGEILQWTPYEEENPAKDVVIAYGIYDVVNGEPNHVMDVGNFTNVYAYNPNDFDGYGTVAAIFEGKSRDLDDLAFSNLTEEVLNVGENSLSFNIYPNPSNGRVTIRGTGMLTISNMIGQIIFQQEIDGESFVELPAGVYVAKLGNSNQKVVVE